MVVEASLQCLAGIPPSSELLESIISIGKLYQNEMHLDFDSVLSLERYSSRLETISTKQCQVTEWHVLQDMIQPVFRLGGNDFAVIILKPPESILVYCQPRSGKIYLFDSHRRPGQTGATFRLFKSIADLFASMEALFSIPESNDASNDYEWLVYNAIEARMLCLKSEVDSKEVVLTSEKQNFLRLAYDNLVLKARLESAERELRASKTPRRISTQIPGAGDMRGSISRSGDLVGSSSKNPGPAAIQEPTSKTFEPATTEVNSSFDCPICTNHYTTRENIFIVSGGCEHECCRDCARLGVKAAIGEGEMPLLCFMCKANRKAGNRCEIQECDIQQLLDNEELLVYYEKCKDKVLSENSAETVRCIDPRCGFAFFQPPGECTVTCQVCASTWCRYCDARGGHEFGITCEEYHENDNNEDLSKKLMENLGVIQCVCKTNLEKKSNCNHIECRSCKRHYCWSCKRLFPDSQSTYAHFGQPGSCVL